MMDRKTMGETCGMVADLFAKSREGLTVRECARTLKMPENTVDFHVRMLLAAGNIAKTGKAALEALGRPGYVYADRKHVASSKAWIAKHNAEREKASATPKKPGNKTKAKTKAPKAKPSKKSAPKAKPSKKKPAKSKAKPSKKSKPAEPVATPAAETMGTPEA